ncbi:MAG TPA: GDSL-type esterase/lipase family protein [Candidatus Binatia bacterium]|nr:GDSL-type esterase/lipase family protein [Candidatus Binatia bacterium]
MGDSYASGQGAPNAPIAWWLLRFSPTWDDGRCNRSKHAPASQAAAILEGSGPFCGDAFPVTSFACSGASIERGILNGYRGSEPPPDPTDVLPPQIDDFARLAQTKPIDALAITVGGNDVLFQYIVAACLLGYGQCNLIDPIVVERLRALRGRLETMARAIDALPIAADRVFLLEYPDPTREAAATFCDRKPRGDFLAGITGCEARWASECVLPKLNYELCRVAQQHGWSFVDGLAGPFGDHGWCASERWINTIGDSLRHQGHYRGGVHPTAAGHERIARGLAAAIAARLAGTAPAPTPCPVPLPNPFCSTPCGVTMPSPLP